MEEQIDQVCNFLCSLSNEDITRHGARFDQLLHRVGPLRGWSPKPLKPPKPSSMITATDLLDAIKKELIHVKKILSRDMVVCVLDHIDKSHGDGDPRLWFSSLGKKPSLMDRILHVLCILHHTTACGGSGIDHLERVSNSEESFKGLIPTYCTVHHLERPTMERCIARGSKVESFGYWLGEPGIAIVAAPVVTLFSRMSYIEIQTASGLLRSNCDPDVVGLARECYGSLRNCLDIFQIAVQAQLKRARVTST